MSQPEPPTLIEPAETSVAARLVNVLVSPVEVFDDVKTGPPNTANWIAPLVLMAIVGIFATMVVFSQGQVLQIMREAQEKQFQKMVDSGKITQQQADQQLAMIQKMMSPELFKVLGILSAIFGTAVQLCLVALFVWLIGGVMFHGGYDYHKAMEVAGLAGMINVLGGVIYLLLVMVFGNMYVNLGPTLFITHFETTSISHQLLLSVNLISFWYMAVLSIGISRLSGAGFVKSAACVFGVWAVWTMLKLVPMMIFGAK